MWTCNDLGKRSRAGLGNSLHESWVIRTEIGEDIADACLHHHVNDVPVSQGPVDGASVRPYLLQCFQKGV